MIACPSAEVAKMYRIRDLLLGRNNVKQDIAGALVLASKCLHPDAIWLTNVLSGVEPYRASLYGAFTDHLFDGRACVLAFMFSHADSNYRNKGLLLKAVELGNAFAQGENDGI